MRILPLIVLSIALVLAGCAKKDDGGATTSTPPTGTTGATTTTTSSTTPTGTTAPTNTTPTTPTKPAPTDITATADWAGPPPAAPAAKAFTIPAGYTMGNLTVKWDCKGAPVCVSNGVTVKAAGFTCALADGAQTPVADCVKEGAVTPGEGKFEYAGNGAVGATITLHLT